MRKSVKKRVKVTPAEPRRHTRMVCLMSEEEQQIVDRYLEKYKITNKSRWLRETILMFVYIWKKTIRHFSENMICVVELCWMILIL